MNKLWSDVFGNSWTALELVQHRDWSEDLMLDYLHDSWDIMYPSEDKPSQEDFEDWVEQIMQEALEEAKQRYGAVKHKGKEYILIEHPELSNRPFPGSDAPYDEPYISEWEAHAMGEDRWKYIVRWQFDEIKGREKEDPSEYPWEYAWDVIP